MVKNTKGGIQLTNVWQIVTVVAMVLFLVLFLLFPTDAKIFFAAIKMIMVDFWWLILPIPLWHLYDMMWFEQVIGADLGQRQYVVFELFPPKDLEKSPRLMEHVFAGINEYSTPNKLDIQCGWRILQGRMAFEITGDEGEVHFYARCMKSSADNVKAQIYSQYPDVEIVEIEDHVHRAPKNIPNKNWNVWGTVLSLVQPDPVPIRTYTQFQEDVTGKMIDPMAGMVEVMSTLPKGQHLWFQIILESEVPTVWHPASKAYIQKIIDEHLGNGKNRKIPMAGFFKELWVIPANVFRGFFGNELEGPPGDDMETVEFNLMKLPPGEQEKLKAIHDNMAKPAFKTLIRFIYFGTKENYNKGLGVAGLMGFTQHLADANLNDLAPNKKTKTFANYYFDKERLLRKQRKIIADFKSRDGVGLWEFMNTEELATLYHFPDMVVTNPSVTRVESRKEDAPANLPVGIEFE